MKTAIPILALLLTSTSVACDGKSTEAPPAPAKAGADGLPDPLPDRDPALAKRLVDEHGAVLLDVRSPEEFAEGHVDGAVNIPHTDVQSRAAEIEALTGGNKDKPIVVYCRSGRRAETAKQTLGGLGYGRVTNLGGVDDWPD